MNPFERALRAVDRAQQRHRFPGFLYGVIKKYGDDRGGQLAALIAYYGFVSLIPLMLLLSTVLGFVLHGHPCAQKAVVNSALADFPIIGNQLRQNVHAVQGNVLAVVIGSLGLLYGALGLAQILQFALAQIWNVPNRERPGFLPRLVRGLLLFTTLGVGLIISTGAAALVTTAVSGLGARIGGLVLSLLLNIGLYLIGFRILTPKEVGLRCLVPGALIAGPLWTALQTFGGILVEHQLRHATQIYGFFATVIGLLFWLSLGAQLTIYAAEANVVLLRRLWPRSIVQPPLTDQDEAVLAAIAKQEERRPEQHVEVDFREEPGPEPEERPEER